jgi:hypothetical protein
MRVPLGLLTTLLNLSVQKVLLCNFIDYVIEYNYNKNLS